ncbi:MAG: ATP-binding protein [candidate division WOR-3 bacterium]
MYSIILLNKEGEIIYFSENLPSLFGYKKEDFSKVLAERLEPFLPTSLAPSGKLFSQGEVVIPYRKGGRELLFFDLLIGAKIIFLLSRTKERLSIRTLEAVLNSWEEPAFLEREGVVILANERMGELLGCGKEDLMGEVWENFIILGEGKELGGNSLPVIVQTREGKRVDFTARIHELSWAESSFFRFVILRKDKEEKNELLNRAFLIQRKKLLQMTEELEKMNRELLRLNEAKSEFVSAVSHDLRTPLTTIMEGIRLCEDGTLGEVNPEQKKFLRLALEEAQRLADFINDLLDLSRIESGRISIRRRKMEVEKLIFRVLNPFQKVKESKGITINISLPEGLPPVFADEAHCYRILNNLLGNALKFTPLGGEIEITTEFSPERQEVIIGVKDTGIGIPKKEQGKIFQKFCRIERSGGQNIPGTGLGLALCKELVEINGGKIWFRSEENKGSQFYFSLPLYSEVLELKDDLKWAEEQTKKSNLPLALFLIEGLGEKPANFYEELESILQKENRASGFYRWLPLKEELVIFLIAPSEKFYDNHLVLCDFLKKKFTIMPLISYQIFLPKEVNQDEILKMVLKKEKV